MSEKLYALFDFLSDMYVNGGYEEDTDALVCNHLDEFIDAGYDTESLAKMMTAEHAVKNLDKLNLKDLNCVTRRIVSSRLMFRELERLIDHGAKFKDLYVSSWSIRDILDNVFLIMKSGCSKEELGKVTFEGRNQELQDEYYTFTREDKEQLALLASVDAGYSADLFELFCKREYCTLTDPIFYRLVMTIADSDIDKNDIDKMLAKNMGFRTYRENERLLGYLGMEFNKDAYIDQMKSDVVDWCGDRPTKDELVEVLNWNDYKTTMRKLGGDFFEAIDYWNYELYDKLDTPIYAEFLEIMLEYYYKQNNAIDFWDIVGSLDKMGSFAANLDRYDTRKMAHLYLKQSEKSGIGPYEADLAIIKKYS